MNAKSGRAALTADMQVMLHTAASRCRIYWRYPLAFMAAVLYPLVLALLPILLGRAAGGAAAGAAFASRVGTSDYEPYMLIGANLFALVTRAIWDVAFWLRGEQNSGTLESWFLAPTSPLAVLAGVAFWSAAHSLAASALSFGVGCVVFGVNPAQGDLALAALFALVGIVPLYGASALAGALVLRLKEADSVLQLAQWALSLLIGIYFPVTVLPAWMRWVSWLLPPTWLNQGLRAALLGLDHFLGHWYLDLAWLAALGIAFPLLSRWVIWSVSHRLRRGAGLGGF